MTYQKTKQAIIYLFIVSFGIIGPISNLEAAPSITGISGTVESGQAVTISGSDFGTKSPVAPVMYADFSSNINPSNLGRITSWDEVACFIWSNNGGIAGGGGSRTDSTCSISGYGGMYAYTGDISFYPNALSQKFYVYRNRYKAYTNDVNLKSMEFNKRGSYGSADLIYNHSSQQWITQGIDPESYFYLDSSPNNQWVTEELVAQTGDSLGAQASALNWYVNGSLAGSQSTGDICLRDDNNNMDHVSVAYHGDYNISGTEGMQLEYFDNLYLDNTWTRILIGNASTFTASTHREIQIPSNWSTGSVTAIINQGSFTNGSTAYLYIVDASGAVNANGFPIEIGGETQPDVISPNAPSGLSVL